MEKFENGLHQLADIVGPFILGVVVGVIAIFLIGKLVGLAWVSIEKHLIFLAVCGVMGMMVLHWLFG